MSLEMKLNGFEDVHYNELDGMTVAAFKTALYEDFDVRDLIVTRDEFLTIRDSEHDGIGELKLLVNSFGNNRKGFLYSQELADEKTALALKIVNEEENWRSYRQTEVYQNHNRNSQKRIERIEQISTVQQIEQIGRIQQIERLQQVEGCINVTNQDYKDFSNLSGTIIYLDPPYENATNEYVNKVVPAIDKKLYQDMRSWLIQHPDVEKIVKNDFEFKLGRDSNHKNRMYAKYLGNVFDSAAFYEWAYNMSKNNIVIISSYEVSDERFEPVFEFKTARSTLSAKGRGNRTEKLFMVKTA